MRINVSQVDSIDQLATLSKDVHLLGSMLEDMAAYSRIHSCDWLEMHAEAFARVYQTYGRMLHNAMRALYDAHEEKIDCDSSLYGEIPDNELWSGVDENASKTKSESEKAPASAANQAGALENESAKRPMSSLSVTDLDNRAKRLTADDPIGKEIYEIYCSLFCLSDDLDKADPLLAKMGKANLLESVGRDETPANLVIIFDELRNRIGSIAKSVKVNGYRLKRILDGSWENKQWVKT